MDEEPYHEFDSGVKITQAKVTQDYQGAISGEGTVEYLMTYTVHGTASFVGMELVIGTMNEKGGSFVIQHKGVFEGGKAKSE